MATEEHTCIPKIRQIDPRKASFEYIYTSRVVRIQTFCICGNKDADTLRGNREADQRLFFATKIVHYLFFLNTRFQATSHLH